MDFDGTCTKRDTTPLLPQLAALLSNENVDKRMETFSHLEKEYFRLHYQAKDRLQNNSENNHQCLEDALDTLDQVSIAVTHQVSASRILCGLEEDTAEPSILVKRIAELLKHDIEEECVALQSNCARVIAHTVHNHSWQLGVLSINWCPSLIRASLLLPIKEHVIRLDNTEAPNGMDDGFLHSVPIWSNSVTQNGIVSQMIPGALAKRERIAEIGKQGFVIYVGDSSTDLAALANANVGILFDASQSTRDMAEEYGLKLAPLKSYHDNHDMESNLWTTTSWLEIQEFLEKLEGR